MAKDAKIYLILPPGDAGPASNGLFVPAPLNYRLGKDAELYRALSTFPGQRRLMYIDASPFQGGATDTAATQILYECMANNHTGVMLDTSSAQHSRLLTPLIQQLMPSFSRHGMSIYISHASPTDGAVTIKGAAPLDGNIGALIKQISDENKGRSFALSLSVRGNIFTLPGRGNGRRLNPNEAESIVQQHRARPNYSTELEAMYALIHSQGREHMLIWDTAETMAQRIYTAFNFGAAAVFIIWAEVQAMWPQLQPLLWSVRHGSYSPKAKQDANHR